MYILKQHLPGKYAGEKNEELRQQQQTATPQQLQRQQLQRQLTILKFRLLRFCRGYSHEDDVTSPPSAADVQGRFKTRCGVGRNEVLRTITEQSRTTNRQNSTFFTKGI